MSEAVVRILMGVRERLSERINERIAAHPELRHMLQSVLKRLDERITRRMAEGN
nr:hypothetical protein WG33_0418 [uncultured bacterium]